MHRDFVAPTPNISKKSLLITGGTGSFGRAFVAKVLSDFAPRKLIVFSRDELKQSEMMLEFPPSKYPCIRYFLGDVRDLERLKMAVRDVDYIIHAAALKQVPAAEYNPMECIKTNVIGAENIAMAALESGVSKVLALSTDKAANPINLYGASKLAADKIFIAANSLSGAQKTIFSVVRYGNVIGSRGSFIPIVKALANDNSNTIPVTDTRMTRFWISLTQGISFVLSSLNMMRGGEIFVPKIPSMKVVEVAKTIAPNLDIKVTGIRPGEKLHETLITSDDARNTFELEDRFIINSEFINNDHKAKRFDQLSPVSENFCYSSDSNEEWLSSEKLLDLVKSCE